jgi:integrase
MTSDGREVEAKVANVGDGRRRWVQLQAAPRLRDEKVSLVLKRLASRAGLADPARYSSHSTRRGFAAELRRHGASDLEIAAAGGWQRLEQVRRYAKSAAIWADPPAARLGL